MDEEAPSWLPITLFHHHVFHARHLCTIGILYGTTSVHSNWVLLHDRRCQQSTWTSSTNSTRWGKQFCGQDSSQMEGNHFPDKHEGNWERWFLCWWLGETLWWCSVHHWQTQPRFSGQHCTANAEVLPGFTWTKGWVLWTYTSQLCQG